MAPTEFVHTAVPVLVPIMTAVLGVLGIVFHDWRGRRTQAGRRKLALEQASRQVSFATEWWNARRLLADSPEAMREVNSRTLAWLEEASALVIESRPPPAEETRPTTIRQLLLLSEPFHSRAAMTIRSAFYVFLGLLVLEVGLAMSDILTAADRQFILSDAITVVLIAFVTWGSRRYAEFVNKRRQEPQKKRPATISRSLLLYRLHGWPASIVRTIFYVWIVIAVIYVASTASLVSEYPNELPLDVAGLIVMIIYAALLRHWAASLGTKREAKK